MTKTYFNRNSGGYAIARSAAGNSQNSIDRLAEQRRKADEYSKSDSLVTLIIHADWSAAIVVVATYFAIQWLVG